ncbi:PPOX class F420-dependent oxidoreductase [Euzebya tangerina]|uniref:PPOX class F420-dependent oxidoreductase n=1 Tax=Euzebya tangerina TaxID=591198 RepID=UPI000E3206A5|nr:PPOX class F420-dependent oxidoreductase [Euzebya tangerina]
MEIATNTTVDRERLEEFLADKRKFALITTRSDGRPQISPVTGVVNEAGELLVASYPTRAKTKNLARNPDCSALVLSQDFNGPWVQLYGTGRVVSGEEGVEALVDYYRCAAGHHDDWDEYRQAMRDRDKVCLAMTITDWGPIATGGVPPEFAESQ